MTWEIMQGDCRERLRDIPDASIDAVVTDPPYELGFMGKAWDASGIAYDVDMWREVLRVLKPGGHMLAFSGSRTYHRMTVAIEDAGFEIRDQIMWVYGSGFPKSKNLDGDWQGWGTALKPAHEPICVARKPLIGTVAENVLAHGTGAINVDGCRVETEAGGRPLREVAALRDDVQYSGNALVGRVDGSLASSKAVGSTDQGRWPANLIHDGSDEVLELAGDAARFFYCAKASKADRAGSKHPTVKPIALMRYLVRLVTPPNGTLLDPFSGSGTTLEAAVRGGFNVIGIELSEEYVENIIKRMDSIKTVEHPDLFSALGEKE